MAWPIGSEPPMEANSSMNNSTETNRARWRLVLGKYARDQLNVGLSVEQQRVEQALDFLYSREYQGRGVRDELDQPGAPKAGLEPTQLTVPGWLNEVRELFPKET